MKSVPSSVLILVMFVSVYIFCVSTYTFIAALSNVNISTEKEIRAEQTNGLSRAKRYYKGKKGYVDVLLSDPWKTNITFNMCCNEGEYLNPNLECIKSDTRIIAERFWQYNLLLSEIAVVDNNLTQNSINISRMSLRYNSPKRCPTEEIMVLTWPPNRSYSYYISQKDGHILELSDDRKTVMSNFSTSSYCLNQITGTNNDYAAIVCPCSETVCIQKCCKKGYYYNTKDNICKEEINSNIKSYIPMFYDESIEIIQKPPYHLAHGGPNCSGPDQLIENGAKFFPLHIQKNGRLMLTLEEKINVFVDNKQYCVDTFSDGNSNSSYINGFYCQNDIALEVVKRKEESRGKEEITVVKALRSFDICCIANVNLFIMVLSILLFVI